MSNTRVLACQIDEKLQKEMKEYVVKQGITVKAYVTGLIKEDLERKKIEVKEIDITKEKMNEENKKLNGNLKNEVTEKIDISDEKEENKITLEKNENETKFESLNIDKIEKENKELKVDLKNNNTEKTNVINKKEDKKQKETAQKQNENKNIKVDVKKINIKNNKKEEEEEFE